MTEKKAPVMPDLVRHLSEKSGRDSGFNPYGLPQNDRKKAAKIPHQLRDDFEGLCGMTF